MSAGLPIDVTPDAVAIDMLKAELPGFESRIAGERDAIGIRGALPIAAEISRELVWWPISRSPVFVDVVGRALFDALETDEARALRHARQREALERELGPVIAHVTGHIRRLAIEATGLEKVIVERERIARDSGRRDGYEAGMVRGAREARREIFAELAVAAQEAGISWAAGVDDE